MKRVLLALAAPVLVVGLAGFAVWIWIFQGVRFDARHQRGP